MRLLVKRAFSLLELIIGMAVLTAFLAMTYFTLAQGVRYVRLSTTLQTKIPGQPAVSGV